MADVHIISIDGVLVVTLPAVTDDDTAERLVEQVGTRLVDLAARAVLVDVSNARIIDSFLGRVLVSLAGAVRLLGAEPVVVGMRPEVAITIVELGMDLGGVATALSIEHGLADLRVRAGRRM